MKQISTFLIILSSLYAYSQKLESAVILDKHEQKFYSLYGSEEYFESIEFSQANFEFGNAFACELIGNDLYWTDISNQTLNKSTIGSTTKVSYNLPDSCYAVDIEVINDDIFLLDWKGKLIKFDTATGTMDEFILSGNDVTSITSSDNNSELYYFSKKDAKLYLFNTQNFTSTIVTSILDGYILRMHHAAAENAIYFTNAITHEICKIDLQNNTITVEYANGENFAPLDIKYFDNGGNPNLLWTDYKTGNICMKSLMDNQIFELATNYKTPIDIALFNTSGNYSENEILQREDKIVFKHHISPNPSKGRIYITSNIPSSLSRKIKIYDVNGAILKEFHSTVGEITMEHEFDNAGWYLCEISYDGNVEKIPFLIIK